MPGSQVINHPTPRAKSKDVGCYVLYSPTSLVLLIIITPQDVKYRTHVMKVTESWAGSGNKTRIESQI